MKKEIISLSPKSITKINETIANSVEGYDILSRSELKNNKNTISLLIMAMIIFIILIFNVDKEFNGLLYFALVLIGFLISKFIYLLYFYNKSSKYFIFFDKDVIIKKSIDLIEFHPIEDLIRLQTETLNDNDFIILTLFFEKGNMKFSFPKYSFLLINRFKDNLQEVVDAKKRGELINKVSRTGLYKTLSSEKIVDVTEEYKYNFNLIVTLIASLIIAFNLTFFLDWNSFRKAKEIDTLTSYREYLNESNILFFEKEAKNIIIERYNTYIREYSNINNERSGAIIKVLEFLRDNNIYVVNVMFKNIDKIKDIGNENGKRIISAENSFTREKNIKREQELLNTLNKTIGKIFPSDMIKLDSSNKKNVPQIKITYTYHNDKGSLYYPTSQKGRVDFLRDYYYGIMIVWDFQMFLPTDRKLIYQFELNSNPKVKFSSQINNNDTVYSDMVFSAFQDFEDEFNKIFF